MTIHDSCTVLQGSTFGAPWRASSACNASSPSWWSQPRSSWRSHKIVLSPSMISTCYTCCLPKFHKQEKSRNCMKSPAWKGGGHAWHCQLPGGWTGSTRSIGWNCSGCTLRGYSHPDTLVITFHVRLASAGDIVFNLPEEIIGNPDRSCTLLLIPSGMQSSLSQSLQSTLLLSSRAAWSLRVSVLVFQVKLGTHRVIE